MLHHAIKTDDDGRAASSNDMIVKERGPGGRSMARVVGWECDKNRRLETMHYLKVYYTRKIASMHNELSL